MNQQHCAEDVKNLDELNEAERTYTGVNLRTICEDGYALHYFMCLEQSPNVDVGTSLSLGARIPLKKARVEEKSIEVEKKEAKDKEELGQAVFPNENEQPTKSGPHGQHDPRRVLAKKTFDRTIHELSSKAEKARKEYLEIYSVHETPQRYLKQPKVEIVENDIDVTPTVSVSNE
ncbi:hypothetical protein RFI_29454, partial [Reticulomyxa filosa]